MASNEVHDRYGLTPDDEFYGLSFTQSTEDEDREVKPLTYALRCLWVDRMGNDDTIEITDDSNHAMLYFDSTFTGGDTGESNLTPDDVVSLDNVLEVDEEQGRVSLFCYIAQPIPDPLIPAVSSSILKVNPQLQYGNTEIYTVTNSAEVSTHYLRYRTAVMLSGVKVGKVDAIQIMLNEGLRMVSMALDEFCDDQSTREWITH